MSARLYDPKTGQLSPLVLGLLAGVDEEVMRAHIPGDRDETNPLNRDLLPAPLVQVMLANVDRLDPNRETGLYAFIEKLAAEQE